MNQAEGATIIGPHTKLRGDLTGTENLLVEGEVEGTISIPGGRVTIGEQGRVRARIFAQEIIVSGRVQGDLLATDAIQLRATAMVLGNVVSPRFVVEQDALLRGHVEPARATEPSGEPHTPAEHSGGPQEFLFDANPAEHNSFPAGLAAAARYVHEATASTDGEGHPGYSGDAAADPSHS
jgi:cytoskeletal protein CcmA (bactofilin family)